MKQIYLGYIDSFKGLSPEVWWLALISLINRAGAMVIPFLTLYLTEDRGLSGGEVGWIMTSFGVGSLAGSWLGGKLTDTVGYYKIMTGSLLFSSVLFVGLQFLNSFWLLCLGVFLLLLVVDAFRPAVFVALNAYSGPENKTRSVTLIRLAINLGFSMGPALGGLIIASLGYAGLFWVDGITCLLAGLLLLQVLNPKKANILDEEEVSNPMPAHRDRPYMLFLLSVMLFAVVFLQYFSTVPLFYKKVGGLSESAIGLLLALNGILIFLFEMPLVKFLESKGRAMLSYVLLGGVLVGASVLIFNLSHALPILIMGMLLMTLGEMVAFPFSNAFAMVRGKKGRLGEYMGLYTVAFSFSHIIGHNSGLQMIEMWGFEVTWYVMTGIALASILLMSWLKRWVRSFTGKALSLAGKE